MADQTVFRAVGRTSLLATALLVWPVSALAEITKDQCVDANTRAQPLRRDGKLAAARDQLLMCGDVHCPGVVRDDCVQRLDELERAQPTVVFDAKDSQGNVVSVVRVNIDGHALTERLDGSALAVDPGAHVFTFEVSGQPVVTRRIVLQEGEKSRREHLLVGTAAPTPVTVIPQSSPSATPIPALQQPPETPVDSGPSGRKTLGIVLGGAGIAGIAVGSIFGVLTIVSSNNSKGECQSPTNCTDHTAAVSDRSSALTDGAISTVGFVAGGALLAGGLALWVTAPSETEASPVPAVSIRVSPSLDARSAGISVTGEF